MKEFENAYEQLIVDFAEHKNMVLSTSDNNNITSRMMGIIEIESKFYFQGDVDSRKAQQIMQNNKVALCIDNLQIEGTCKIIGLTRENLVFCEKYKKYFLSAYTKYTHLDCSRLFEVTPTYIQKWIYQNSKPFVEKFFFDTREYKKEAYIAK